MMLTLDLSHRVKEEPSRIESSSERIEKQLTEIKVQLDEAFERLRNNVIGEVMSMKSKPLDQENGNLQDVYVKLNDIRRKRCTCSSSHPLMTLNRDGVLHTQNTKQYSSQQDEESKIQKVCTLQGLTFYDT
ncbi:hypothetical protein DPMN_169065 [Dreissena polymorpha]|uniref:Uncharacterized protein n=1 Tax=Dreissena polymorpha TaxID=45954 RepID=A0A9D4F319_DREPO|nr:hypothetical protein DPMN_169065 [Dreissena polymorpha]